MTLGPGEVGPLEFVTMVHCDLEFLGLRDHGTFQLWNLGTMELRDIGTFFEGFSMFFNGFHGFSRFFKVFNVYQCLSIFFKVFKVSSFIKGFQGFLRFHKVFHGFSRFFKGF